MPISYGCSFKKSHLCCVEIQAVLNPISLLAMQRFREVYCGISHLTLAFSRYTHSPKRSCVYQEVGYPWYTTRKCCITILYHTIEIRLLNLVRNDIAAHDRKVEI